MTFMMKKRYIAIAVLLLLIPMLAGAQALKGSYFIDNSMNRHRMNPAFTPRANYFQLPVIGNTSVAFGTNLDVDSFLYPRDGQLLTFLNQNVSVDEFQSNFPSTPHLDFEVNSNLLSFGFFTKKKAFWNFDLDMRVMTDVDLPSDLFLFLKKGTGTSGETFNIGNVNMYATGAVQAALGYSRDITKGLRLGIKARAIAPLAYAGVNLEKVTLTTGKEQWNINTEGYAYAAMQGLEINLPEPDSVPEVGFNLEKMLANKALAGFGYSFDLGLEYRYERKGFFNGFRVSASVTDLGLIHYSKDAVSSFKSKGSLPWVGFQDVSLGTTDFQGPIDDFLENANGLLNLEEDNTDESLTRSTMPRIYAGVEVPFMWERMSVGLLYSARFSHSYMRQELTASLNLKPLKWLALGANYSFLNTGGTIGWILELTPKVGPTFYIGGDYLPLAFVEAPIMEDLLGEPTLMNSLGYETWMLPMSLRLNLHFGMAFTLGSKHGR